MRTLLFSRADVAACLPIGACIEAVQDAFWLSGEKRADPPSTLSIHGDGGNFHIKAGTLRRGDRHYFAAKANGNFPANPGRHGLPTIQGVVLLCDADDGRVLAIMDSIELTALRTAAATAVAARHLTRDCDLTATIVGCGVQARAQLLAAGRESDDEIIIFDSTGIGLQDVAAAAAIYEAANASGAAAKLQTIEF